MSMSKGIVGIILAGGEASRMGGGDKGMLALAEASLMETVIARLSPQVDRLALNANGDPERFAILGLDVVSDPLPERVGPLGGILAGLQWARQNAPGATHIVTAAADTPFFPDDLVDRLTEAGGSAKTVALARSGERLHPVFGLWPVCIADDLARHIAEGGSRRVAAYACDIQKAAIVDFPQSAEGDPFFNVNTPDDLEQARDRSRREKS
ncbi:molybdenum cofactor guanylyltransferase MobA [Nitratireductor sp.]|uniref:molybdenum cofactor guanylyltransferase MobA n=1 Tax=Nitratireductor sp. TaxID=1872084 RepID=UPI00345B728C